MWGPRPMAVLAEPARGWGETGRSSQILSAAFWGTAGELGPVGVGDDGVGDLGPEDDGGLATCGD